MTPLSDLSATDDIYSNDSPGTSTGVDPTIPAVYLGTTISSCSPLVENIQCLPIS